MHEHTHHFQIHCDNPSDSGPHPLTTEKLLHFTHDLSATGLFDDLALIRLLDDYPDKDIHVTTMTTAAGDEAITSNWRVGTTAGLQGEEILAAVRKGRLWLNIKRLAENAPAYQQLMAAIYQQLASQLHCSAPDWQRATLLISSPTASVYYHADSIPNVLWHIRGEKKLYVYPHNNEKFAPREQLELICSGESEEELAYHAEFDSYAELLDLKPGQAVMWPQHSPHRVINTQGLNVSLSTEHITPQARQLVNLYRGNRLIRKLGVRPAIIDPASLAGRTRRSLAVCQSAARKLLRKAPVSFDLTPTFRVDPDAELGYREINRGQG